jgi:hypothetical protein
VTVGSLTERPEQRPLLYANYTTTLILPWCYRRGHDYEVFYLYSLYKRTVVVIIIGATLNTYATVIADNIERYFQLKDVLPPFR